MSKEYTIKFTILEEDYLLYQKLNPDMDVSEICKNLATFGYLRMCELNQKKEKEDK